MTKVLTTTNRVLTTGGRGYIGELLNSKHLSVMFKYVVDNDMYTDEVSAKHMHANSIEGFEMPHHRFDAVIHLADNRLQDYTQKMILHNHDNLSRFLDTINTDRVILASSCSVYGFKSDDVLCDEQTEPNPTSYYAESKLMAESLIKQLPNYCILRFGTAYGRTTNTRYDLLINQMYRAVQEQTAFDIYDMDVVRPYVQVNDIARSINYAFCEKLNGTYNVSYENLQVHEIVERLKKHGNTDVFKLRPELAAVQENKRNYRVTSQKILNEGFEFSEYSKDFMI